MKKILYALLLVISLPVRASDAELFAQANTLYDQKEYAAAMQKYQGIKSKGASVLYNMGNACYKQSDFFNAMIYWQRSIKNSFGSQYKQAYHNCDAACQRLDIKRSSLALLTIDRILVLVAQLLFLLCWYLFLWLINRRRTVSKRLFIFASIAVVCTAALIAYKYYQDTRSIAYVVRDCQCHAGPGIQYTSIAKVAKSATVTILDESRDWLKVTTGGSKGWMHKDFVTRI